MDSCIAALYLAKKNMRLVTIDRFLWTTTEWWQHQSDCRAFNNCVISKRCGLSTFSHRVNRKNESSQGRTSKLSSFISEYRGSQRSGVQIFNRIHNWIIPCDLCYDVTFLNSSMPRKPVYSVKSSFSANIWSARLGFISDRNWLMQVIRMHSMWYVHILSLNITFAHPVFSAQRSNTMSSNLICLCSNEHSEIITGKCSMNGTATCWRGFRLCCG